MLFKNDLGFMEVLHFEESTASMTTIRFVTYNPSLEYSSVSFKVFEHLFVRPELWHLAHEQTYVYSRTFKATFAKQNFLLDCLFSILHLPYRLLIIDHLALSKQLGHLLPLSTLLNFPSVCGLLLRSLRFGFEAEAIGFN